MMATRTHMITGGKEKQTDLSYDVDVGQEGKRKSEKASWVWGVR